MHIIAGNDIGKKYKQTFIGRLFGKMILKNAVKDESPMKHSTPTLPEFKNIENTGDITTQKKEWAALIEEHTHF